MVSKGIFIGVAIGVFFAGIGIGYAALQSTPTSPMMSSQQMMNDPEQMKQWMSIMMENPQQMQQMIMTTMHDSDQMTMMENMMADMMERMQTDPELEQAMMKHMANMKTSRDTMMGGNMMDSEMMNQQMQGQIDNTQTEKTSSYVEMVDGVQVVTINAKEFKFVPSEIHISAGETKFVMMNNGVGEHELVVYDASKKDIVDKAELAEDEATIEKNILFEIEEVHAGESGETEVMNIQEGSYVMGCHVPGHYEAGMKGTLDIE